MDAAIIAGSVAVGVAISAITELVTHLLLQHHVGRRLPPRIRAIADAAANRTVHEVTELLSQHRSFVEDAQRELRDLVTTELAQMRDELPKTMANGMDPKLAAYASHESRETNKADKALENVGVAIEALGDELTKHGVPLTAATWIWENWIPDHVRELAKSASQHKVLGFIARAAPQLAKQYLSATKTSEKTHENTF